MGLETIGVGLIGTGYMGKCHALAWNAVAPVFDGAMRPRLVHLAEVDGGLAAERASDFGFEKSTGNWREVIADREVEVVSITTPNQFHAEMAIAALEAGKHVWCEKPMAVTLADAERMAGAARRSGKIAALGYNYIQNPITRQIGTLVADGAIGAVNHFRLEMDEDFMADAPFGWKSERASGYGALDDFGVHPLSLIHVLLGRVERVMAQMSMPFRQRPLPDGTQRDVETWDIASVLLELEGGVSGLIALNRAAWGRKGRIALQIFGSEGTIVFDQERMNEFAIFRAGGPPETRGFTTVLAGPAHEPYGRFVPAPGHGLGFNDLKVIEARELLCAIAGEPARIVDFAGGLAIERAVHAMSRSHGEQRWVTVSSDA